MDPKVENRGSQEDGVSGWGKSLPVASIQEIVRNDPESVPERYKLEHKDRPLISDISPASVEIPVIDFSLLAKGEEDERRKIDLACKEWRFFLIINYGVAEESLYKMKAAVAAFFEPSPEEKRKYAMPENDIQGYWQADVVSDEQKLDWCDIVLLIRLPPEIRNVKFWPNTLLGFNKAPWRLRQFILQIHSLKNRVAGGWLIRHISKSVDKYSREAYKVADEICANISLLMGMDREGLKRFYGKTKQAMRMNYYPPCSRPELLVRISPHSDSDIITLLLQDDDTPGLQIKQKHRWFLVKPIPNAIVVNVGDVMEVLGCQKILSNGMYRSIEHRAITNDKKARISVATAMFPDDEPEICHLESMVDDHHCPRMYRKIKDVDYLRYTLERKSEGKAHIEFVKLESN